MTTLLELSAQISHVLGVPHDEAMSAASLRRAARVPPSIKGGRSAKQFGSADGARLLTTLMVTCLEGPTSRAAERTQDLARLRRLRHGALLYLDQDFILPDDFIGAAGGVLTALADPARRDRARDWIGSIGLALGNACMVGWIELDTAGGGQWEDFSYAAAAADVDVVFLDAPMVRQVEVKTAALTKIAEVLFDGRAAAATWSGRGAVPSRRPQRRRDGRAAE